MKLTTFALAAALAAAGALAQQAPSTIPKIKFTDTRLDNGLRVIVSEDHYAPVYAICVSYKVGSRDERKGRTGFAHLFEHMMFKGSENLGMGPCSCPARHRSIARPRRCRAWSPPAPGSRRG